MLNLFLCILSLFLYINPLSCAEKTADETATIQATHKNKQQNLLKKNKKRKNQKKSSIPQKNQNAKPAVKKRIPKKQQNLIKGDKKNTKAQQPKTLLVAQNAETLASDDESEANEQNATSSESSADDDDEPAVTEPKIHYIRVLLEEHTPQENLHLILKSKDGFILESPAGSNITALFQAETLNLTIKDNQFLLQCQDGKYRRIKSNDVEICSPHNTLKLNNQMYQGSIHICYDQTTESILIINKLDLEDYLYSVLKHEGISSWPIGMHKVQAIASRTYALYHMKQVRTKTPQLPYDIKNTSHNQIYNGTHEETHLRKAVEDTRNLILTYKGNIALTMFDICCGGIKSGLMRHRDVSKPYLCRTEPCNYCKKTAYYTWHETVHKKTLFSLLTTSTKCKDRFKYFGKKLIDMQIIDKDKAGVVYKIKCVGTKGNVIISAAELKSALQGKLKSLAFSIKKNGNHYTFSGHGNSHFFGLCQWGAKELIDRGYSVQQVLEFYYPKTKLSRLI